MKPESALRLPLTVDNNDRTRALQNTDGGQVDHIECLRPSECAALVTMCNAYPLALKLAEACEAYMGEPADARKAVNMAIALTAFKAHRTAAQHDEKGGDQ